MKRFTWPWRSNRQEDEPVNRDIGKAKEEAAEALTTSYQQLEHVRELDKQHEPVRQQLRRVRERNGFAEGLMRVIEEGR